MAFRTKLNISDDRLIIKKDNNPSNEIEIDPNTIVETNSILDLDFDFISNPNETTFKLEHNVFTVYGDEYYLNKNNFTDKNEIKSVFFKTDEFNVYSGVSFIYMVENIIELEDGSFSGNGFTDEYIEYSAKGLNHTEIEKEVVVPEETTKIINYEISTETIVAEDNKIELNFGGTHTSALEGGFVIINGVSEGVDSTIKLKPNGEWSFYPGIQSEKIIIPKLDENINENGTIQWDNDFLYIKTEKGLKKVKLENI